MFLTTPDQPRVSMREMLQPDPNPYYSSCCFDPQPVALSFFRCYLWLPLSFSVLWGRGQHSSPAAFDPGFLTRPPVSFPETADTPFDPRTLLRGLSRGSRGCRKPADVQTRLADWFEPVPEEAVQVASGWAFIIINYSGRLEKGEKFVLFARSTSSAFLGAY